MKKKERVLVASASDEVRGSITTILKEYYEIVEVSDAWQMISHMEDEHQNYDIALIGTGIMQCGEIDVFEYVSNRQWASKMPVVAIADDEPIEEEFIVKIFNTGFVEVVRPPFYNIEILGKMENVKRCFYQKASAGEDALVMLSSIFFEIFKVNLTTDFCERVRLSNQDITKGEEASGSLSVWIEKVIQEGLVFESDVEEFRRISNPENLRREFWSGKKYIDYRYRRRMGEEIRWVSMVIVPAMEYKDDNQILIMYIRDIHDEYTRYMEELMPESEPVESRRINLTKHIGGNASYEEFVEEYGKGIPYADEKQLFYERFRCENLISRFLTGEKRQTMDYLKHHGEKGWRRYQISVDLLQTKYTDDIEGIFCTRDVTESYIEEKLPELLYNEKYESVSMIDVLRQKYIVKTSKFSGGFAKHKEQDYQEALQYYAQNYIASNEKEIFCLNTSLSTITRRLSENETYDFTIYQRGEDEEYSLKEYKYMYFDRRQNLILATIEDVTNIVGKDVLTSGLNRRGFIQQAMALLAKNPDTEYSMLFFDIKGFKAINELFDIEGGDDVIRYFHNVILNSNMTPVLVGRLDADHFVCIVKRAFLDTDEIIKICHNTFQKDGKKINLYARCGIYHIDDRNLKISGMFDRAKIAATHIDNEFVKPYEVFAKSMSERYVDKTKLMGELDYALDNKQFKVFYQPVFDAKTGKIASAEALVRWEHPSRGLVSPGLFVPALEENGHISKVDSFVQNTVWKFLEERKENNKFIVPVSVNLSWMDFYDVHMMESILSDVKNTTLTKGFPRFEVTETSYAAMASQNGTLLRNLRSLGAQILLDDFGSGYSSFSTVRDYEFDIIKLDMGFVQNIRKNPKVESIIHSIIDMAHHVNAKVIAEGAETKEQVDFLIRHDCDYIQGYYFSKPLSQEQFESLLEEQALVS